MSIMSLSIDTNYWNMFKISEQDQEFLYNHLLEIEIPQTPQELLKALLEERIRKEKANLAAQSQNLGSIYLPKGHYQVDQKLVFPNLKLKTGTVINLRQGVNPDLPPFDVIEVQMDDGNKKSFATGLEDHTLNQPVEINQDDPLLDIQYILKNYSLSLLEQLNNFLEENEGLVRIAGKWFPQALLVDVNIGHLNLAEAVLDMHNGGPLSTQEILEQVELPTDVNVKLTEFSFNLSLQEDGRFDEVGLSGEVQWFLRRLEPEFVQSVPPYLRPININQDTSQVQNLLRSFQRDIIDELEPEPIPSQDPTEITLSLLYPHWKSGTLPLSPKVRKLFPSAYESPRVRFTFIDNDTKQRISGWVVRASDYVFGLREWYVAQGLIPGSIIHIKRSEVPGEVIIWAERKRPAREWIRTALVGSDGALVFAMLKQLVVASYDERLTIAIPDPQALDALWDSSGKAKSTFEPTLQTMFRELAKLNPQGHVHAFELYAAMNLIRRCSPGLVLTTIHNKPWARYLGDLYFRPEDQSE